jgi:hypothetical protein
VAVPLRRPVLAPRSTIVAAVGALLIACAATTPPDAEARAPGCPAGMARIDVGAPHPSYCIDRYEGSLVEATPEGEKPFSPYDQVKGRKVKAVTRAGVVPQAYISRNEAETACRASRKRLCTEDEWTRACEGRTQTTFPYGDERKTGYCNDNGKAPLASYYAGASPAGNEWDAMNDPRLNQMSGTIAKSGSHPHCKSSFGVYDMVGNVHEWIADPAGTFLGGYYLDTKLNGDGCHYKTVAHDAAYHDYSTGFRCCADVR